MVKLEVLVLISCLIITACACAKEDLQMVQIISKHCSFAPPFTYPEDPNPASIWSEGLDDLTMLGKFQAYALGVFLRNYYKDFITSDPREVEVFSSADKGVAKSAQSLITALYNPNTYWEVVQNFSWQPIYINYDTDNGQFLSEYRCPAADIELNRITSRATDALVQTYKNLLYYWSVNSGMNLKTVADVEKLYDTLITELAHNLTIPEWSQAYWDELKYFRDVSNSLKTKTAKMIKLMGGSLIEKVMNTMLAKTNNDQDPRKVVVYSSRTAPLLALLACLDLNNGNYLPPCSSLLIELYKQQGEYLVRFLFMNSTTPQKEPREMYSFSMPGCMEFCPLKYVIEYARGFILKNAQECFLI